jgi:hypothetical protein
MAYAQEQRPSAKPEMDKNDIKMTIASALRSLLSGKFGKSTEEISDKTSTASNDVKQPTVAQLETFVTTEQLPVVPEKQETVEREETVATGAEQTDSGVAETPDVQVQLYEMRNKISSLRQTQSELQAKMARYNGQEPIEGEICDEPMPVELNMKVMKRVLEQLQTKQETLSMLVEELAQRAPSGPASCLGM